MPIDKTTLAHIASEVAKQLGRDQACKQRILTTAPHLHAIDAAEMSAAELAKHELKGYGIDCSNNSDPVEVRDAFHAGRKFARDQIPGNRLAGGNSVAIPGKPLLGSGMDSSSGNSALDNYLKE